MIMKKIRFVLFSVLLIPLLFVSGCSFVREDTNYFDTDVESTTEESIINKGLGKVNDFISDKLDSFDYKNTAKSLPKSVYDYDVSNYLDSTTEATTETLESIWDGMWR